MYDWLLVFMYFMIKLFLDKIMLQKYYDEKL